MKTKQNILVLTNDVDTESALRILFASDSRLGELQVYRTLDALAAALDRGLAPLVLVDIDADPQGLLEQLDPLVNHSAHSKFVVLARELENDIVIKAMHVGIRYVQLKERIAIELPGVVQRVLSSGRSDGRRRGSAITVLSAGGGSGCTTLTVNLANELQLLCSEPVLIADLDYAYGAVASYLELEGKYGIADVLGYEGVIDGDLIETTAVRYSESVRTLLSPASTAFGKHRYVNEERLGEAVVACKSRHRYTVIDAARVSMDAAAELAMESQVTLIVAQPAVKDIRVARSMINALSEREVPLDRIKPVLNRYRKRREIISVEEAQKALAGLTPECLSNDYVSAINGNNYGKLLSASAPRSALRKDVTDLATRLATMDDGRAQETDKTLPAFRRVSA